MEGVEIVTEVEAVRSMQALSREPIYDSKTASVVCSKGRSFLRLARSKIENDDRSGQTIN